MKGLGKCTKSQSTTRGAKRRTISTTISGRSKRAPKNLRRLKHPRHRHRSRHRHRHRQRHKHRKRLTQSCREPPSVPKLILHLPLGDETLTHRESARERARAHMQHVCDTWTKISLSQCRRDASLGMRRDKAARVGSTAKEQMHGSGVRRGSLFPSFEIVNEFIC